MSAPVLEVLREIERRNFAPRTKRALKLVALGASYRQAARAEGIQAFQGLHVKAQSVGGLLDIHREQAGLR